MDQFILDFGQSRPVNVLRIGRSNPNRAFPTGLPQEIYIRYTGGTKTRRSTGKWQSLPVKEASIVPQAGAVRLS